MLTLSTIKEGIFTLEICQSQKGLNSYFAFVIYGGRVEWSTWSDNLQAVTQKGASMLKNIALTDKCNTLATKYFKESVYYQSIDEPREAKIYYKKYSFYNSRFEARCDMGLWIRERMD